MFSKKIRTNDPLISFQETEVWVADFGSPDIEEMLRQEVVKLKPKEASKASWIFSALLLLVILVGLEYLLMLWSSRDFWPTSTTILVSWLWRLLALVLWLYISRRVWRFSREKVLAVAFSAFILATIILDIIKIVASKSIWAWLNLLIEPIWAVLLVAIVSILYFKIYPINK